MPRECPSSIPSYKKCRSGIEHFWQYHMIIRIGTTFDLALELHQGMNYVHSGIFSTSDLNGEHVVKFLSFSTLLFIQCFTSIHNRSKSVEISFCSMSSQLSGKAIVCDFHEQMVLIVHSLRQQKRHRSTASAFCLRSASFYGKRKKCCLLFSDAQQRSE